MNGIVLYFRVNQHCNARCFMCDFWKNPRMEAAEEQLDRTLEQEGNLRLIRFTGGEPLLCEKLERYIEKCHQRGIRTSVITNGILLQKRLDRLVKSGLDQIVVSVDGSTPAIHDKLRGVKGLWEKIDGALARIASEYPQLHTRVNTVASEQNLMDLQNMAHWLDARGVEQWSVIPIKRDGSWSDNITFEAFRKNYTLFQNAARNARVKLMGYSADWAEDMEAFWRGECRIGPNGYCHLTKRATFYDPFTERMYPCNCIPHRGDPFKSRTEEADWYYFHGKDFCKGCEPLNAWCADHPEKMEESVFLF